MSFSNLGLAPALLRALDELGYATPTPIQSDAIPYVLAGKDLFAGAQTGTGKTAAFALPTLHALLTRYPDGTPNPKRPRVLVLTPTRELAAQVEQSYKDYGRHTKIRSHVIFGGVGMSGQVHALSRGVDVLVACPGRLLDHADQRSVDLSRVEVLVLDEADRMLDMGFLPALRRVLALLPKQNRQTLLFSATFSEPVKALAAQFMKDPVEVQVTPKNTVAGTICDAVHPVVAERKKDLLLHLIAQDSRQQMLVFARTKHGSDKLVDWLEKSGVKCAAIHGNKSQNARTRALDDFKRGKINVLVATDIAARGIDIDLLPLVVNFDLPAVAEDYVHRIGRTGRNGSSGRAVSLVSPDETGLLFDVQGLIKRQIEQVAIAGFAPPSPLVITKNSPRPAQKPQQGRGGQRNSFTGARSAGNGGGGNRSGDGQAQRGKPGGGSSRPATKSAAPHHARRGHAEGRDGRPSGHAQAPRKSGGGWRSFGR